MFDKYRWTVYSNKENKQNLQKSLIGAVLMEIQRQFYLDELLRKQGNGFVKIITGLCCRCGKSYLGNRKFVRCGK